MQADKQREEARRITVKRYNASIKGRAARKRYRARLKACKQAAVATVLPDGTIQALPTDPAGPTCLDESTTGREVAGG